MQQWLTSPVNAPQLYLNEHGLTPDGRVTEGSPSENDDGFSTFFSETGSGKVRAAWASVEGGCGVVWVGRRAAEMRAR